MSNQTLTIAIPTFNRCSVLLENLKHLLPQIDKNVDILIIDNCSDIEVENFLKQKIKAYDNKIKIVRNTVNIGSNANILRCIEYCESDYIWILGDDDFPLPDALEKIKFFLAYGDAIWINFHSNDFQPKRISGAKVGSMVDFLNHLESINELVFMSNNIYKTSYIKKGLSEAYLNIDMMAPHLISMLYGVIKSNSIGNYYITRNNLFLSIANNKDKASSWSLFRVFIGTTTIFQLPVSKDISKELMRLVRGARKNWLANKYMVAAFWELSSTQGVIKALQMSSHLIINLLLIDRFKYVVSLPLYLFSIFTGSYFWPHKEMIKKAYKKLLLFRNEKIR
jgi:glycosyltransferase involved in cell wall biosynthesis